MSRAIIACLLVFPFLACLAVAADWPQWGGTPARNNAPQGKNIPSDWHVGGFDRKTGAWKKEKAKNIKWVAQLGSQTFGTPVVAGGRVYVGTNNNAAYLERYPRTVDLGCLLCFREADGEFLWQFSGEKLPTGLANDWPLQGILGSPLVEKDRLWLVTNRCEMVCLNPAGLMNGEADVVWRFDMIKELGVFPHNFSPCSVTAWGDTLFVCTSNGVDESHRDIPRPDAPSFLALDKHTGKVLWTDNSPGDQIMHTQWSSPAVGRLGMEPQVIFAGGDGWLYSFRADRWNDKEKKPELLWKFDGNPKESKQILGGRGTRNEILAMPVIHDGLVYLAMGQDPEHGEGPADLWCIDPTKRGDVSAELAVRADDRRVQVPRRRVQAVDRALGEAAIPNPNSAVVWHYTGFDQDGDGKLEYHEKLYRSRSAVAVQDGLLVLADFSGIVHCLDSKSGKVHWTHDQRASNWGSPLIVDKKIYVADEDGDVAIFGLSADRREAFRKSPLGTGEFEPLAEINMDSAVYTTPIVANNVLFIANKTHLFAIDAPAK